MEIKLSKFEFVRPYLKQIPNTTQTINVKCEHCGSCRCKYRSFYHGYGTSELYLCEECFREFLDEEYD